ncbi:receptor-like protein 53 isoform X2 [Ziziphus jujuba]|uniref:Receptor-like protein 53 isoform X2 n=1 Tax=Ziziphus jujuba TaxID=326968 RepID=A0ABM4AIA9_ZIZJJ|nr:receptor-like protein 53 isoform X2 [Ziziphus jujuba]
MIMGWFSWLYYMLLFFFISSSVSSSSIPLSSAPPPFSSFPSCHIDDSKALLQFKNSFSIDYASVDFCDRKYNVRDPKTISWESGTDCCGWSGVTCNNITGHVIGLDLTCGMLRGIIHSNSSLFLLRHLQTLILSSDNDFRGSTIPPEFGTFTDLLHLEIDYANFAGDIPLEISYLSKLQTLEVYDGNQQLRLNTSTFKRIVTNLTNLQNLTLSFVDMSRVDLASLMNLSSSLKSLRLWHCGLQGNSPNTIFHLPKLEILYLDDNDISGQIPWSSFNLERLTFLSLASNNFIGELPKIDSYNSTQISLSPHSSKNKSLGPVPWNLESLSLSNNFLNGTIPNWLFALPSLQYLDLGNNEFTGHIPKFETTSLTSLYLNNNKLNGSIPISIFQLVNLTGLDLSSYSLSGFPQIDLSLNTLSSFSSISSKHSANHSILPNLGFLRLSYNKIQGNVPKWLFNVGRDSLTWLDLSYNFLTNIERIPWKNLQLLDLSSNFLDGHLLPGIGNLRYLSLSHNQIRGNIPKWMWNAGTDYLHYLNLSHNFLTHIDRIPWKKLHYLDLRSNILHGHLPIPPPSIEVFSISHNQLIGEVPSLICNLSSLKVLDLANNSLTGKLPPCMGNLSGNLSVLDLRMNKFQGTIPTTLFVKENLLRNLNLNGNELEGLLPRSLLNCKKLEVLDIGNNQINGTFPHWLESLPMLQVLILRSNKFYGSIASPMAPFPFKKLRILDLADNKFSGILPAKYFESLMAMMETDTSKLEYMGEMYYQDSVSVDMKGIFIELVKIQTIFTTIDLSKNNFVGDIPKLLGNLKSLKGLNFSHNQLTGFIPPSLGNLSGLEWLDLSSNQLVGRIPQQLTDITFLAVLNLSNNSLDGPIPRGKQFDTFENTSYGGNLGLCGLPLTKTCSNDVDEVQKEGDEDEQTNGFDIWKIIVIGYGCGVVVGISIGYMVLSDRRIALFFMKKLGGERWIRRIRRWKG